MGIKRNWGWEREREMGMNSQELAEMGSKKTFPLISITQQRLIAVCDAEA